MNPCTVASNTSRLPSELRNPVDPPRRVSRQKTQNTTIVRGDFRTTSPNVNNIILKTKNPRVKYESDVIRDDEPKCAGVFWETTYLRISERTVCWSNPCIRDVEIVCECAMECCS